MYEELFEGRFLRETEEFYAAEGVRYMATADVPHFLQHVERRLEQVRHTLPYLRYTRMTEKGGVEDGRGTAALSLYRGEGGGEGLSRTVSGKFCHVTFNTKQREDYDIEGGGRE